MPSNNDDINDNEVLYRMSVVREGVPFVLLLIILLMTIELEAWRASNPFSCPIFTSFVFICLTRLVAELISCNKCESFELVVVLISEGCNHDAWQQISPHSSKSIYPLC